MAGQLPGIFVLLNKYPFPRHIIVSVGIAFERLHLMARPFFRGLHVRRAKPQKDDAGKPTGKLVLFCSKSDGTPTRIIVDAAAYTSEKSFRF